ncbi:hypothetical protein [Corynebacterium sp. p3-SID1056]|nr:hypothetical protein [Corynebacterium sp. p3-SID1056]MCT2338167.1 hypothetical protein [Corynebacterium sp. p3-SID1056]
MIATILSSLAFIWAILETFVVGKNHPTMPIAETARTAAARNGVNF